MSGTKRRPEERKYVGNEVAVHLIEVDKEKMSVLFQVGGIRS